MKKESELNGAWEEPGVIGTRIEIAEPNVIILWRNAPVLVTRFKRVLVENGFELQLQENGLRYENAPSDYASVTKLFYHDNTLEMIKQFPISGESVSTLRKTENSRYGNYDIVDEILEELKGTWKDEAGYYELTFSKDVLKNRNQKIKIHVLKSKSEGTQNLDYKIVDQEASHYELFNFMTLQYTNGVLIGKIMVFDAKPMEVILKKCL